MTQKQQKIFYPAIFFFGLILMTFQIEIFRNTIIDSSILIAIILVVALITFIVDFQNYKTIYKYSGFRLYLFSAMHYIIGFGFII